jgi:uncharacterized protein
MKGKTMRRKDREIADPAAIRAIMETFQVCRLGMVDGNKPYIVPLCFGYHENALYFHGALEGRKIGLLRNNPQVCFEFDRVIDMVESDQACNWSMRYHSVVGSGKAVFIENPDEKRAALAIIMGQYSDRAFQFPDTRLEKTAVFKVDIESITGKRSGS